MSGGSGALVRRVLISRSEEPQGSSLESWLLPAYHLGPARPVPVRAVSERSEDGLRGRAPHRAYVEHAEETHFTGSGTFTFQLFFFFWCLGPVNDVRCLI